MLEKKLTTRPDESWITTETTLIELLKTAFNLSVVLLDTKPSSPSDDQPASEDDEIHVHFKQ